MVSIKNTVLTEPFSFLQTLLSKGKNRKKNIHIYLYLPSTWRWPVGLVSTLSCRLSPRTPIIIIDFLDLRSGFSWEFRLWGSYCFLQVFKIFHESSNLKLGINVYTIIISFSASFTASNFYLQYSVTCI